MCLKEKKSEWINSGVRGGGNRPAAAGKWGKRENELTVEGEGERERVTTERVWGLGKRETHVEEKRGLIFLLKVLGRIINGHLK